MGVLAEGSCLKSKFSNVLTTLFIGCAGIMQAQGKPCIAYGVEAGDLTPFMQRVTRTLCSKTHFLARSQPSLVKMRQWGLKAELGTDTAWDIEPASASWAKTTLQKVAGWDGQRPLLAIAPINPFCWPVKASLKKYLSGHHKKKPASHYAGWHFFSESPIRSQLFQQYLTSITQAVRSLHSNNPIHPIIVGMDALDQDACRRLQKMMPSGTAVFNSHQYNGYQLAALLRQAALLITSRYHARVLSMPAGVPAIAVSMDERLPNLLVDNSHLADYCLAADDSLLAGKLTTALRQAWLDLPYLKVQTCQMMPYYLDLLENMGLAFRQLLQKEFPLFPLSTERVH
jgi:polysaccharide pyruvyl transferase WcaK-like protein